MRKFFLTAFVLAASLAIATSGLALEKTAARLTDDGRLDDWNAGTSCSVRYYNTCTGWVWVWSGWSPNDRLGVCFDNCCAPSDGSLVASDFYVWTAAPAGYGYTGTVNVFDVDANCCPTNALAPSQPFFPVSGWNTYFWGVPVGAQFAVAATFGPAAGSPIVVPTDHPDIGPTGPTACGTCFPVTRPNHSYYWGTPNTPLCPGSSLFDGLCDAQLFMNAYLSCVVSVEEASWGSIKNLYR